VAQYNEAKLQRVDTVAHYNEAELQMVRSVAHYNEAQLQRVRSVAQYNEAKLQRVDTVAHYNEAELQMVRSVAHYNEAELQRVRSVAQYIDPYQGNFWTPFSGYLLYRMSPTGQEIWRVKYSWHCADIDETHACSTSFVNKYKVNHLSLHRASHLYRTESLHPPAYHTAATVLRTAIIETRCMIN